MLCALSFGCEKSWHRTRSSREKLLELEHSLSDLDLKTQRQLKEIYGLIRELMNPPPEKRRGIGFTADLEGK